MKRSNVSKHFYSSLLLLSLLLTGTVIVSCVRENGLDSQEIMLEQPEVTEARLWFEERMYAENYMLSESGMMLYRDWIPNWKTAVVHQLSESRTVEIPLLFSKQINAVAPEAYAEYERTKDQKYLQNDTKLVIETNLITGEKQDFIMNIAPSLKYINLDKKDCNSYRNMDENFDGAVFFFDPKWNFVNGWEYSDGKIYKKMLSSNESGTPEIATRSLMCAYQYWYVIATGNDLPIRLVDSGVYITCYDIPFGDDTEDHEDDGGFDGGGGGGSNGNGDNNNERYYPTLDLSANGDGEVSPSGVTYYNPSQSVTLHANPRISNVFAGWFESSSLLSHSQSMNIQMNTDRYITGLFYNENSECGQLALKYRNNEKMNTLLDIVLRRTIAINGAIEYGAVVPTAGTYRSVVGTAESVDLPVTPGLQYKEAHHSHTESMTLTPSPEDLQLILKIGSWEYGDNPPNGFIFTIINSTHTVAFEVENMARFTQFAKRQGFNELDTKKFEKFKREYYRNIIKHNNDDYETNGLDRSIEWLLKNNSGLKVSKATIEQTEDSSISDWTIVKWENNQLKTIKCNEL